MIRKLLESYRLRQLDPFEFCRQRLTKQLKLSHINAFITVTDELALVQAEESSKRFTSPSSKKQPRLLEGVPIAVKDNFSTRGIKTTCGSLMLANYVPPYTATPVRRLLDAGAVLVGKTNMDEFAMGAGSVDSYYGPVKSPWSSEESFKSNDWLVTGGSSGGSGAAVASGIVLGALGSDTGGSTRSPSSMMGIVGYKPSYGLFSRHGLIPLVNSLDCVSIIAPTPADCALLAQAMAPSESSNDKIDDSTVIPYKTHDVVYNDTGEFPVDMSKLRIGIPKEYVTELTSGAVLDAWQFACDLFAEHSGGAQLVPVSLPHTQFAISAYSVLCCAEVASNMARYDGLRYGFRHLELENSQKLSADELLAHGRAVSLSSVVRSRILAGNYFLLRQNYEKYVKRAMAVRRLVNEDFENVFKQVDILLTPLMPIIPESSTFDWFNQSDNRSRVEEIDVFTMPANLTGVPAVSVPVNMTATNYPRSVQLMAPRGSDRRLLAISDWLYQQTFSEVGSNLLPQYRYF